MGDNSDLIDCYFYFYKTCKKESWCPFRHCQEAIETEEVCQDWLKGVCYRDNCPKRHMNVQGMIKNLEKGNLASKLIKEGLARDEALNLAKEYYDLDTDPSIYQQNCEICLEDFPRTEMFSLMTCQHEMCVPCAKRHFETQIRDHGISKVVCPFADCTVLKDKSDKEFHEYFQLLITQLREILPADVIELLETKIRDRFLAADPNFVWCPQCANGMFRDENFVNAVEYLTCPNCHHTFCIQCKKPWKKQHAGLSCEEFQQWNTENDPAKQTEALQNFLEKFGVECPKCNTKFAKASGGCLHLVCPVPTCEQDFCEGCLMPFYKGKTCPNPTPKCESMGLHAHHPRNCLFYLRDWEPVRLQKLLNVNGVRYETKSLHSKNTCPLMEQKEKEPKIFVDEECGLAVEPDFSGLCRKHYVQYLGWLIVKNKLDPLPMYTVEELKIMITNSGTEVPEENSASNYQQILLDKVKKLQLSGDITETTTISEAFSAVMKIAVSSSDEEYLDADGSDEDIEDDHWDSVEIVDGVGEATGGSNEEPMWQCSHCTFLNEASSAICLICCRTRIVGLEDYELEYEGIECHNCTFINENTCEVCIMCGYVVREVAQNVL